MTSGSSGGSKNDVSFLFFIFGSHGATISFCKSLFHENPVYG
jgi:hypothetical protein